MKNQYFGDIRDLFKYDLISWIIQRIDSIDRFTFIPMLTEDDNKSHGRKRDFKRAVEQRKPGTKNEELMKFLIPYGDDQKKRDIREIREYFESCGIKTVIYRASEHFKHKERAEYFKNIDGELLSDSLIFLDPDIGLEVKRSRKEHLLYREVKELYERMNENAILMIYQHFPRARKRHEEYLPDGRSKKLGEIAGDLPLYISDNEVFFLFLTKNAELKKKLQDVLRDYKDDYNRWLKISS